MRRPFDFGEDLPSPKFGPHQSLDDIRRAAKRAYSGWNGWNHDWRWRDDGHLATRIQREAIEEAAKMREKIDDLRRRIRECEILAGQAAEYAEMAGEVDHE